jgi:SOS-response transcriptional repressor LexA
MSHSPTDTILDYIKAAQAENRFVTVREIQRDCKISSNSVVSYHLDKLEDNGKITRTPHEARSIRLVETEPELLMNVGAALRLPMSIGAIVRLFRSKINGRSGRIMFHPYPDETEAPNVLTRHRAKHTL